MLADGFLNFKRAYRISAIDYLIGREVKHHAFQIKIRMITIKQRFAKIDMVVMRM